jgi:hypothetical protein
MHDAAPLLSFGNTRNRRSALECVPRRSDTKKLKALQKSHTAVLEKKPLAHP